VYVVLKSQTNEYSLDPLGEPVSSKTELGPENKSRVIFQQAFDVSDPFAASPKYCTVVFDPS
jgi:hypothetical protein